jgi:hypothetical protein
MSSHAEIKAAEPVARKTVATTLQHNGFGLEVIHYSLDGRLEHALVCLVRDAIAEWKVDGIVLASANADVAQLASAGEVLAVFVERDSHYTVGGIESFLNAVAVMYVNVNVEDSLLVSKELDDPKDDV